MFLLFPIGYSRLSHFPRVTSTVEKKSKEQPRAQPSLCYAAFGICLLLFEDCVAIWLGGVRAIGSRRVLARQASRLVLF